MRARDPAKVPGRFYLRFNVDDRPGVMAEIAGILGRHNISIASVIQHETEEERRERRAAGDHDPHVAPKARCAEAMKTIDQLACVHPGSVRMRVRD